MSEPSQPFRAPVGTHDVLPPESARWQQLVAVFADLVGRAGYGLVQSPMFEELGVFQRIGEGTDVVRKEMYDFEDKGGRHVALRPEGTASVVRAFVQHRPALPWKAWYVAPSFRYERPQAGRFRQHHQVGVELLGTDDPDADVEIIALGWRYLQALGLGRVLLLINSMGDPEGRAAYLDELRAHLRAHKGDLAAEDRDKIDAHPLRVLDSKRAASRAVTAAAPKLLDHLSKAAERRFERVQSGLRALGVPFAIEPRLVRGLDYYTHTTFEFQASTIEAAQSTVLGGGRYDGLVAELGGPPTPGMGFGSGIERTLLACDAEGVFDAPGGAVQVFVVDVAGGEHARDLTDELRSAGIGADRAFDGRSMKSQMKAADRSGARLALIVGEDEAAAGTVAVRDLREQGDQEIVARTTIVEHLRGRA